MSYAMPVSHKLRLLFAAVLIGGCITPAIASMTRDAELRQERTLLYALSMAALPERQEARWKLADHYLGEGKAPDAIGVLAAIIRHDPKQDSTPRMLVRRGTAHYLMGHMEDARSDLETVVLDGDTKNWLRRAVIREHFSNNSDAILAWKLGVTALPTLSLREQVVVRVAVARSALAEKKYALLETVLVGMPNSLHGPEVDMLRAQAYLQTGKPDFADYYLTKARKGNNRRIIANVDFIRINAALDNRKLTIPQAIAQLDKLRFAWRGDRFELAVLKKLADLYKQSRQWRPALGALRQASSYIPEGNRDTALAQEMRSIFAEIFTKDGADKLPPLEALSLFSDYRDLAPLGEEGDQMIRKLSDRLVDVGLPDRAAGLVEYQVRYRLSGTAQAVVALRAAVLDIMANQPKAAVAVLRATKQNDVPEDIARSRHLVEARALIQLADTKSALDIIEGVSSPLAEKLRADAYWRAKNWKSLQQTVALIYSQDQPTMTIVDQRLIVRWAFALAMDGSASERDALRKRFGGILLSTSFKDAFALLTSSHEISSQQIRSLAVTLADIDQLQDVGHLYKLQSNKVTPTKVQTAVPARMKYAAN